jgi:aspartyl-tRNA(Asn)/glutamyl-tRNA(Gln) amidotransferase subunit B
VQRALEYEIRRQAQVLDAGDRVVQETRLYDSDEDKTYSMRSKEEAHDYRYFPEPDLPPLLVEKEWIEEVRKSLPDKFLSQRREEYVTKYGLLAQVATTLTSSQPMADYFEATATAAGDPKAAANWISSEVLARMKEGGYDIVVLEKKLPPARLGKLIARVKDGTVSGSAGKEVLETILRTGQDPDEVIRASGLAQVSDEGALKEAIEKVVAASPGQVAQYKAGKTTLLGYFVGQVLKATGGKANPALVNRFLKERLDR